MTAFSSDTCPADAQGDRIFKDFVNECERLVERAASEGECLAGVAGLAEGFAGVWRMPDARFLECQPDAMYASYLLYGNADETLNVVLDVFLPGQAAAIHNHRCWCVFTCLEGVERERLYVVDAELANAPRQIEERVCHAGQARRLGSAAHLFHQVESATDEPAVSLHVYGADIGRLKRDMWDEAAGAFVEFTSDYSNDRIDLPAYFDGSPTIP